MKRTKKDLVVVIAICMAFLAGCGSTGPEGSPPDVRFHASEHLGGPGSEVKFTLIFQEKSDYTIQKIDWDLNGDGVVDSSSEVRDGGNIDSLTTYNASFIYTKTGEYTPNVKIQYKENDAGSTPILESDFIIQPDGTRTLTHNIIIATE